MPDLKKTLLGFFLCTFLWNLGCGSEDSVENSVEEPDLVESSDIGGDLDRANDDMGEDMRVSVDLSFDSGDLSPDADVSMAEAECICADPLATCHPDLGLCVREDIDCSAGDSCPDGFECAQPPNSPGFCVCDGTYDECGPFCDENELCPGTRLICDSNPQGGVCRQLIACAGDYECGPGKLCTRDQRVDEDVCVSVGTKQVGETCTDRLECKSRYCFDGVCTEPCSVNTDCPSGETCVWGERGWDRTSDGCIPGTCGIDGCDESESRCMTFPDNAEFCVGAACEVSGDCPDGDCVVELGTKSGGTCEEPEGPQLPECKPGEFKAYEGDPYCRLPGPCWDSSICQSGLGVSCDDCPSQYECLHPGPNAPRSIATFCSRLVD